MKKEAIEKAKQIKETKELLNQIDFKIKDDGEMIWHSSYLKEHKDLIKFVKDVKEFIRLLKEEIYEDDLLGYRNKKVLKHYSKIIDKLSGDLK